MGDGVHKGLASIANLPPTTHPNPFSQKRPMQVPESAEEAFTMGLRSLFMQLQTLVSVRLLQS